MLSRNFGFTLLVLYACSVLIGGPAWGGNFDGVWAVKQVCPRAPDGALGYTYNYTVTVRDDALDGEHVVPNNNGSIRLHGTIGQDGTAYLNADGVTGPSQYSVKGVAKGSPVHYHVWDGTRRVPNSARGLTPPVETNIKAEQECQTL